MDAHPHSVDLQHTGISLLNDIVERTELVERVLAKGGLKRILAAVSVEGVESSLV